ncbi:hypothetical protein HOLleu_24053 [Holothuria leucospilota]|uniref:Uncharacterized protein n=1 Tax=Holothuria leucospilota TaxID=206669 RepID=A0A9Q1H5M0_HOLLE|nr:hypothetical protein HOLleu_24053 [Holothuria leucospilota]
MLAIRLSISFLFCSDVTVIGDLLPWLLSILIAVVVIALLAWLYFLMKRCTLVRPEASIPLREDDTSPTLSDIMISETPPYFTNVTSSQSFRVKAPTYASYDFHPNPPPSYDEVISSYGNCRIWPQEGQIFGQMDCTFPHELEETIVTIETDETKLTPEDTS